ncbi:MAG: hypothetical protein Q4F67_11660 [Propionibacteriaceae bacterium]|nr:hypothetical protein [Propionibacteriaceae bacterium]
MSNFAPKRTQYGTGDRRWARNFLALDTHDVSIDTSSLEAGRVYPSGTHIGEDKLPRAAEAPSVGLLVNDLRVDGGVHLVAVASGGGPVDRRYLPEGHDEAAEASLTAINFIN